MEATEFVHGFVLPLLAGGPLHVGRPLRPKDRDALVDDRGEFGRGELRFARQRRAEELSPHALLPDPDLDELTLWAGLHNVLVFDHPDRPRVWARSSTWRRAEGATRTMLTLPFPSDIGEGLARHASVGAFIELERTDTIVTTTTGEARYLGQPVPRRRFRFSAATTTGRREETAAWLAGPHAPETHRLIEDAMRASPLTCLLNPLIAPPGWSPLWAVAFVQSRPFARAVCHHWAAHKDWIAVGGAVMSALMPSLPRAKVDTGEFAIASASTGDDAPKPEGGADALAEAGPPSRSGPLALPGAVIPTGPEALVAVIGALVHLHFLKVLELDARLGVALGSRDPGILWFLALPLLLPRLGERTGSPLGGLELSAPFEGQAYRRWTEYVDHLGELVPRTVIDNLHAAFAAPFGAS